MSIMLRRANINDSQFFFFLRTLPQYDKCFYSTGSITYEQHNQWFQDRIDSNDHIYMVAELNNEPVACVRFDPVFYPDSFEIGFILHPDFLGLKLSFELLTNAILLLRSILGGDQPLIFASVFESNLPSLRVLDKVGFIKVIFNETNLADSFFVDRPTSILLCLKQ